MSAGQEAVQDVHTGKQEVDLNLYHTINQSFHKYYKNKYWLCCLSCYYIVLTLPFPTSASALPVSA